MITKEVLEIEKYFNKLEKYFIGEYKYFIEYRLGQEDTNITNIIVNFSSDSLFNSKLFNTYLLKYLKGKIKNSYYIKLLELNKIVKKYTIAYQDGYYRVYFSVRNITKEGLGKIGFILNINEFSSIFVIGINLNTFDIKVYNYISENNVLDKTLLKEVKHTGKIKHILKLIHKDRNKLYFRFRNGLLYKNQPLFNSFGKLLSNLNIHNIYINYIAYELSKNKTQIYITNKKLKTNFEKYY